MAVGGTPGAGGAGGGRDDAAPAGLMPLPELKALLHLAKRRPVSCAVAMTNDGDAVLHGGRLLRPRKAAQEMRAQARAAGLALKGATIRFGRLEVEGGDGGQVARVTVNKPAPPAMARALRAQVRPAGVPRCEILVDETLEQEPEEDAPEDGKGAQGSPARREADTGPDGAGPPPNGAAPGEATALAASTPSPAPAPAASSAALEQRIVAMVRRMGDAAGPDPAAVRARVQAVRLARDALRAGDLPRAERITARLEEVLGAEAPAARPSGPQPSSTDAPLLGFLGAAPPAAPTQAAPGPLARFAGRALTVLLSAEAAVVAAGVTFVAVLTVPTNTQRQTDRRPVAGHPEREGEYDRPPGQISGRLTIRPRGGAGGGQAALELAVGSDGSLRRPGQGSGPVLGTLGLTDGVVRLTPEGEALLGGRPGPSPAQGAASPPGPQPPPLVVPDPGFEHDPNDPEEAELVAGMHGRSGTEIQNAINALRARRRGQAADGNRSSNETSGFPTDAPVPRTGRVGGRPRGTPQRPRPQDDASTRDALVRETQSIERIAAVGYDCEFRPRLTAADGLRPNARPDVRYGGEIADVYSPETNDVRNVVSSMAAKVAKRQTFRLIVNLEGTSLRRDDLVRALQENPIPDLRELIVDDPKDGSFVRVFPNPADLGQEAQSPGQPTAPGAQVR